MPKETIKKPASKPAKSGALTTAQKKELAEILFMQNDLQQKEIAEKVGVSQQTMTAWVAANDRAWDKKRQSMLTSKNIILRRLYKILDNESVKMDDAGGEAKDADKIVKLTAAIRNLETDTGIGELMEAGKQFINFLRNADPTLSLHVTNQYDTFIKERLKRF
ncbi:MAG: hypothetical protein H0X33_14520 [Taibaiella sp.]|nr:hypothetical protein [Taibaiella sp.]